VFDLSSPPPSHPLQRGFRKRLHSRLSDTPPSSFPFPPIPLIPTSKIWISSMYEPDTCLVPPFSPFYNMNVSIDSLELCCPDLERKT